MHITSHLPPNSVDVDGPMIDGGTVGLLCGDIAAVVMVVLHLLSCCPSEDIGRLVTRVRRQPILHFATAAVVHLEHRGWAGILVVGRWVGGHWRGGREDAKVLTYTTSDKNHTPYFGIFLI